MRQVKYYIFLIVFFCGFFYGCFDDPKVEPGIQNAKIPQLGTTVKIERGRGQGGGLRGPQARERGRDIIWTIYRDNA